MTVYTIFGIIGVVALILTAIRQFVAKPSNIVVCYIQNFVGSLFIFSGFVKAVDPLGTSYKMHEYFEAFAGEGMRPFWEWAAGFSTFMAISMIALELFIGFMLLIGWKPKFTVTIIWWLTLFFTVLTGYTYLSGYGITKLFMLASGLFFVLLALIPLPKEQRTRANLMYVSLAFLIILYVVGKFSGLFFTIPFDENKMKVTDCGCFGDFMKLKPWETFYKDVILDLMIFILVIGLGYIKPVFQVVWMNVLAGISAVLSLGFCLYTTYFNEPPIDFRPYAIGSNVREARIVKVPPVIEMSFVYMSKKTGEKKEFTYDDMMKSRIDYALFDTMLERKDNVKDPGIPAKITNLLIENDEGMDYTDSLLSDPDYSLMVVSYDLTITHESAFKELNAIAAGAGKVGVDFYAVAVNDGKLEEFRHRNQTAYKFYHADATPLKTIIRSNPGLVLLKNGVVINKWHYRHLPTFDELNSTYFKK